MCIGIGTFIENACFRKVALRDIERLIVQLQQLNYKQ